MGFLGGTLKNDTRWCSVGSLDEHFPKMLVKSDVQSEGNAQMGHCNLPKDTVYSSLVPGQNWCLADSEGGYVERAGVRYDVMAQYPKIGVVLQLGRRRCRLRCRHRHRGWKL
ncbi:hypothetical protein TNCV_604661 [Trichonephila clavipes]|nr:hypothetical protein TNCV_604661 [Trichonephila clavipes]